MLSMLDHIVYLNDNCPPRNQYVLSNCINIINEIYSDLRRKYRIPKYVDKEWLFEQYLRENEVEEIFTDDLPSVSKSILQSCKDNYPAFLKKRVKKLQEFFDIKEGG